MSQALRMRPLFENMEFELTVDELSNSAIRTIYECTREQFIFLSEGRQCWKFIQRIFRLPYQDLKRDN